MKLLAKILTSVFLLGSVFSCADFFEQTPENMLQGDDNYTERANVYATFMGLLATLQDVADDLVILAELRGDLMMPTDKAPDYYWDLYRHEPQADNPAVNPNLLYRIVLNCNDFLRNTVEYNRSFPGVIPTNTYKQMIAGAVTLRTWAYLNIGKIYGEAAYHDYALEGEADLSKIPVLSFDELIPELIHFMNTGVDNVNAHRRVDIDEMFGVTGNIWRRMAVAADPLMLELYLWNKDYQSAAKRGINLITGQSIFPGVLADNFTCSNLFGSAAIGKNIWHNLFSVTPAGPHTNEGFTIVIFDYTQRQINPLHSLFSVQTNMKYYFRPTQVLIDRYDGVDNVSDGNTITDERGKNITFGTELGESVIFKYHYGRTAQTQDASIYIYRTAEVFLMIAEALNALGNYDAAEAIFNEGFKPYWVSGNKYEAPFDAPIYAFEKTRQSLGVRGRMGLPAIKSDRFMGGLTPGDPECDARRKFVIDSILVEETAREFAIEGKRWFTALRIARNNDDPEFLAGMMSAKYPESEREFYKQKLAQPQNWFIQYDLGLEK